MKDFISSRQQVGCLQTLCAPTGKASGGAGLSSLPAGFVFISGNESNLSPSYHVQTYGLYTEITTLYLPQSSSLLEERRPYSIVSSFCTEAKHATLKCLFQYIFPPKGWIT